MTEKRKHTILFAATILAARKLNESGIKPWGIQSAIHEAVSKAEIILEEIDQRWPAESGNSHSLKGSRRRAG